MASIPFVVATNRPFEMLCDKSLFRSDLLYRLSGVDVRVPPRSRNKDIMELAQYCLFRPSGRRRLFAPSRGVGRALGSRPKPCGGGCAKRSATPARDPA